ncbi:MAG: hypothetical protein BWX91_00415 [Spirochaetes bacterium ADurb.Bin133]|nr:MAG: hypothetical protein BWX91_00415 [Spirochaetes bacterium ADurb.Bin133]
MKKLLMSTIFYVFFMTNAVYCDINSYSERLYAFFVLSFHRKYEIYCSKKPIGYYKYKEVVNGCELYLTYEGRDFLKKCKFDENYTVSSDIYPLNIYANNKGEVARFRKKFGPVIEKNRERKRYPHGYGEN